MQKFARSAEI